MVDVGALFSLGVVVLPRFTSAPSYPSPPSRRRLNRSRFLHRLVVVVKMADRRRQRASQDSSEEEESDSPPGSAAPSPRGSHRLGVAGVAGAGVGGGSGDTGGGGGATSSSSTTSTSSAVAESAEAAVTLGGSPADSECVSGRSWASRWDRFLPWVKLYASNFQLQSRTFSPFTPQ